MHIKKLLAVGCLSVAVASPALAGTDFSGYITDRILTIPASTAVTIDDDNAAAFADVTNVVFAANTSTIDFQNATALTADQTFSGSGAFKVTGGNIVLSGDNSAYKGQFTFTDCFVEVTGRYALGNGSAKVSSTNTRGSTGYYQLTFSGDGLTCDAPLSVSMDHKLMKPETEGQLVLTKKMTLSTGNSNFYFVNMTLQGGFASSSGSPYGSVVADCEAYIGASSMWQYGFSGGNNTKVHFTGAQSLSGNFTVPSRMRIYTEVANAVGCNWHLNGISTTSDRRAIDLCGKNQSIKSFTYQNYVPSSSKSFYVDVTSDTPATMTVSAISGTTTDHNFRFRKEASFTCNVGASSTFAFCHNISDSIGILTVKRGTLDFKNGAGWGGTNVVVCGGTLNINSETSVTNKENCRLEVTSGLLNLNANLLVKSANIGGVELEAGDEYAVDDLPAEVQSLVAGTGKICVDYTPGEIVYKRSLFTGAIDGDITKAGNWADGKAPNLKSGGATLVFSNLTATTVSVPSKAKVYGIEFLGGANCELQVADGITLQIDHGGILSSNSTDVAGIVTNTVSGLVQTTSSEEDSWIAWRGTVLDLDCDISAAGSAAINFVGIGRFLLKGDNTNATRPFTLKAGYYDIFSSTGLGSPTRTVTLENRARFFFHCLTNDVSMSGKLSNTDPITGLGDLEMCDLTKRLVSNGSFSTSVGESINLAGVDVCGGLSSGNLMVFSANYNQSGSGYGDMQLCRFLGGKLNLSVGGAIGLMLQRGYYEMGSPSSHSWPLINIRASDVCLKMTRANGLVAGKPLFFGHEPNSALGTLDLNGFDQTVAGVDHMFYNYTRQYDKTSPRHGVITSDTPAMLTLTGKPECYPNSSTSSQRFNPTNNTVYSGAVGLRVAVDANNPTPAVPYGVVHTLIQNKSTTTGTLAVESGKLVMAWGAGWTATTNVVISGGTLEVEEESAPCAFGSAQGLSRANMTISGSGNLKIDGGQVTVRSLSTDGGETFVPAGVYGSAESGAEQTLSCLSGKGTVKVRRNSRRANGLIVVIQ